jgi:prepilin-type N-terminal cleavage/methylation domain-containing protein
MPSPNFRFGTCSFFEFCDLSFGSSTRRRGFTLTEILIVIGIIVLLVALAVPAFSLITGGRSVEGATNQLSAALGRARAQAIGLQKPTGIMFFIEPRSQRAHIGIVNQSEAVSSTDVVWLDLADADFIPLPRGISVQTIGDTQNMGAGPGDRYIGFNIGGRDFNGTPRESTVPYGGVILFDGNGRLASTPYGFRCVDVNDNRTALGGLLKVANVGSADIGIIPAPALSANAAQLLRSQLGLVMFEQDLFASQAGTPIDPRIVGTLYGPDEQREEQWLDSSSTPLLINRYTGTLVKGE